MKVKNRQMKISKKMKRTREKKRSKVDKDKHLLNHSGWSYTSTIRSIE